MRLRSKAREIALCILYEIEISKRDPQELIENFYTRYTHKEETRSFSQQLVEGVIKNSSNLDLIIKKHVRNWEISRMAIIDRTILRMSSFELIYIDDIPPKVSINEAVELAKKFGDVDSPRFVNGILDKVYKLEQKDNIKNES